MTTENKELPEAWITAPNGWIRANNSTDIKLFRNEGKALIHRYTDGSSMGRYFAGVERNSFDNNVIFNTIDEAISHCETHIDMPIDQFKKIIAEKIIAEITPIHEALGRLGYPADLISFKAGYTEGHNAAMLAVNESISLIPKNGVPA